VERFTSSDQEESDRINENCDDMHTNIAHEDEEPKVGMTFSSEEEVTKYYNDYARSIGFGISKINSKTADDGKKYFTLACSRARKHESKSKNLLKPNPTTRTQCKARVSVVVSLDGIITVSRVALEHNDELSPTKSRYFRCNKILYYKNLLF
jgi:hypothetical protein